MPETSPSAFLVFDTESVPDGKLLAQVRYAHDNLSPEEAVNRAQAEARAQSAKGSDFLPITFQFPVAICVLRVAADYSLQAITCLDAPEFRPRRMTEAFWAGLNSYRARFGDRIKLVTFNGRGFDVPLLELAAFRYGINGREHFQRKKYDAGHLDLMDWLSNGNAYRLSGGLNLLSKLLGKPGKMNVQGDMVYQFYLAGKLQDINDYCMFDTLDTYFVLLRTRVLSGELSLEQEHQAVLRAKAWLEDRKAEVPALQQYLDNWGDWNPWP